MYAIVYTKVQINNDIHGEVLNNIKVYFDKPLVKRKEKGMCTCRGIEQQATIAKVITQQPQLRMFVFHVCQPSYLCRLNVRNILLNIVSPVEHCYGFE
jgi:hypothetical protein